MMHLSQDSMYRTLPDTSVHLQALCRVSLIIQSIATNALRFTAVMICLGALLATDATAAGPSLNKVQVLADNVTIPSTERTESDHLAYRLLMRESQELVLDTPTLNLVSAEIEAAINAVRDVSPRMVNITARPDVQFNVLLLKLEPALEKHLARTIVGNTGTLVALDSGSQPLDKLNEVLGLFALRYYARVGMFEFYFEKDVNLLLAANAYSEIEGVRFAEPNEYLPESTDIEVFRQGSVWHFIFKAGFAGLTGTSNSNETTFFRVRDGRVDRYESDCTGVPDMIPCPRPTN